MIARQTCADALAKNHPVSPKRLPPLLCKEGSSLENRIDDCRELYLKYNGKEHEKIEIEMRALGHTDFHRRVLYRRFERGRCRSGWAERYGFDRLLKMRAGGQASLLAPPESSNGVESDGINDVTETESPDASQSLAWQAEMLALQPDDSPFDHDFDEFVEWLKKVSPNMSWEWKHQKYIYKRLKKLADGVITRLMIFLPPRHGKSELVTVRFTAWMLKQKPETNVILGSYNQRLANRFSRKIRRVLADDAAQGSPPYEGGVAAASADGVVLSSGKGPCGEEMSDATGFAATSTHTGVENHPVGEASPPLLRKEGSLGPPAHAGGSDKMFPFANTRPKNTEAEWETTAGGGLRAVGVGSGVTGFGADLVVVDDPVKSRSEAESKTYRDRVWDWFNDDIYTRLEKNGKIVLIQTRWHEDDLAGRLLKESREEGGEKWTVIDLPALAETGGQASLLAPPKSSNGLDVNTCINVEETEPSDASQSLASQAGSLRSDPLGRTHWNAGCQPATPPSSAGVSVEPINIEETEPSDASLSLGSQAGSLRSDPLGRKPGEALCPDRFDENALLRIKAKLGSYSFAALYQQKPVPAEGGLFKRKWFEDKIVSLPPPKLRWFRGTDPGISAAATADYTASFKVAIDGEGNLYIAGGFRRQVEYPELRRWIVKTLKSEPGTQHAIEQSAHGPAIVQDIQRMRGAGTQFLRGIKPTKNKIDRAIPWLALAEQGKVFLVRAAWNEGFLDEAASFPLGTHDDQIDAVSLAFSLANQTRRGGRGY